MDEDKEEVMEVAKERVGRKKVEITER